MSSWLGQYCINVPDLDKSVAVYEAMGLQCTSRTEIPDAFEAIVEHPAGGTKLQLAQQKEKPFALGNALRKLYVNTHDIADTFRRAVSAGALGERDVGVRRRMPPRASPRAGRRGPHHPQRRGPCRATPHRWRGLRMIRLSVLYPKTEGATFDHDYYRDKHVPLCLQHWGVSDAEIDKGVDGPYLAAVHFRFESAEAMQQAMGSPGTAEVQADVANYTTIAPVLQISEVVG